MSSGTAKGFPQESAKDRMHISFLAGIRVIQRDRDPEKYSGYQVEYEDRRSLISVTSVI